MRRRWVKVLTVTVVVLAVLFTVVDRVAVHYADGEVADLAAQKYGYDSATDANLDVSITGFPFLTQALGRDFDHVTLDADHLLLNSEANRTGDHLDLTGLHIDLYDVSVPSFTARSAEANRASGRVTLPYANLAAVLGRLANGKFTVTPAGDDQVTVAGDLVDFETGARTPVRSTGRLQLAGDELGITVPGARKADAMWRVPLPEGVSMTAVHTKETGVEVTLEGHLVTLGSSRFTR
ncbi:LmeA family phospholipid-binding protein [Streptomyces griseosporeus]|uniref:LmeA family phospholipid-binding protein n=1 Tax=Streptomyces griseosporeus TaxID=1910 RepID=UPI0036A262C6